MRPPARSLEYTQVTEYRSGQPRSFLDSLVAEEPLEIRIGDLPLTVTMRTPGHDAELAAGFLLTEGIVDSPAQIDHIHPDPAAPPKANRVIVRLRGASFDPATLQRNFFAASSCGICGKTAIESIRRRGLRPPSPDFRIAPDILYTLPEAIRREQGIFDQTGGLHAAALFDAEGHLLVLREDVGRHNAVDKVIGWAALHGQIPLAQRILMLSGRGGFEIIQKALAAGVPILAAVSAPSSLSVRLAREMGLTLIGFLRGQRFVVYAGEQRILPPPCAPD